MADSIPESDVSRSEIQEKATNLEERLMSLEQALRDGRPTIESVHFFLGHAHSLKGTLGMLDRQASAACVHSMESAFIKLREGQLRPSSEFFDLGLATIDQVRALAEHNREDEAALADLSSRWHRVVQDADTRAAASVVGIPFALSDDEAATLRQAIASGRRLFLIAKSICGSIDREEYDQLPIYASVAQLGTLVARRPYFEDLRREQREALLLLVVASEHGAERLKLDIFDPLQSLTLSDSDSKTYLASAATSTAEKHRSLRSLIVEDDFTSRLLLQRFLAPLGESHVAVDGEEAILAVRAALANKQPYDLICLDIMMPKMDGQAVLRGLRQSEERHGLPVGKGAKVIMTTCLKDAQNIMTAFREQCDAYVVKPVARAKLMEELHQLGLVAA